MKSLTPFIWLRRVAMRDIDAWGIVWYGNYLIYCDEARAELFRSFGLPPGSFSENGWIAPVVEVHTRYYAPARFDEEVEIQLLLLPSRGARLVMEFSIINPQTQELLTKIKTTQVLQKSNGDLMYFAPVEVQEIIDAVYARQNSNSLNSEVA